MLAGGNISAFGVYIMLAKAYSSIIILYVFLDFSDQFSVTILFYFVAAEQRCDLFRFTN